MKIDGSESDIVRQSRAYGHSRMADYIEAGGEIGPDERRYIVEQLRDELPRKTGPRREKEREEKEAKIVLEILRVTYFWGVTPNKAITWILDRYGDLNGETVKGYWKKYRSKRPTRSKSVSPEGQTKVTTVVHSSDLDETLGPLLRDAINYLTIPSYRGKLANTEYPVGYRDLGLTPMEF